MQNDIDSMVKDIFRDTYNFYIKYRNISTEEEVTEMVEESKLLNNKYNKKLYIDIVLAVMETIERRYLKSKEVTS